MSRFCLVPISAALALLALCAPATAQFELKTELGMGMDDAEITRDGKYALVSVWDIDGALVVYDAKTLAEVKRLPMKKPSGKYNVYNKITRSSGTSH